LDIPEHKMNNTNAEIMDISISEDGVAFTAYFA
jgi:hypothetical protein